MKKKIARELGISRQARFSGMPWGWGKSAGEFPDGNKGTI
jgi:hypothetical protein